MIRIEKVSFGYEGEQETLHECSLHISDGECVLLCGESGCGKTTVTKLINGLIPHFTENCRIQGSVEAEGLNVAKAQLYELAKHIGSVFQNPKSQFFNLDTDSELAFGLENEGAAPERIRKRLEETTESLHIQDLLHRDIFSLSGGEKQMLAFASVYAMKPSVFVLDEPTANLDEAAVLRLREQIRLLKAQGHMVIIAEHRLYFLAGLIDRAVYIKEGRVLRSYTAEEFWQLDEQSRAKLGLRSLTPVSLQLLPAGQEAVGEGLVVKNLSCGYKRQPPVFENLSFAALPGEVLAVTGVNGAGKTTLIRCLCGLLKERTGWVMLDGSRLDAKKRRQQSFLVMQDVNHQLFYDSVWNECEQAAQGRTEKIEEALSCFELLDFKERHPMALSGGQKQRLAVAVARLYGKRILLFDEPTSGLDYRHMLAVCSVVRELARQGHIVLVVSHDREFMQSACDRVLKLQ